MSPELVNQFESVISKAMGMKLNEAVNKRKELQERLQNNTTANMSPIPTIFPMSK